MEGPLASAELEGPRGKDVGGPLASAGLGGLRRKDLGMEGPLASAELETSRERLGKWRDLWLLLNSKDFGGKTWEMEGPLASTKLEGLRGKDLGGLLVSAGLEELRRKDFKDGGTSGFLLEVETSIL